MQARNRLVWRDVLLYLDLDFEYIKREKDEFIY